VRAALGPVDEGLRNEASSVRDAVSSLDGRAFLAALERSASRVATIASGDAASALRGSLRLPPAYREADEASLDPGELASRLPELGDEILTCLRDDADELRRACLVAETP